MTALSLDSRLTLAPDVVSQNLDGELVMLSLDRAEYYGLNRTATRVWHWIMEGEAIRMVADKLAAEYQVDGLRAQRDVLALAQSLLDEGLATLTDACSSA